MAQNMEIQSLVGVAVLFVVAAFVISMGATILTDLGERNCDYTWITNTSVATGNVIGANPVFDAYIGCCQTVSPAGSNNCTNWVTNQAALNVSAQGNLSMAELGSWLPTLALVMVAAVIIAVLVAYLGGAGSKS